MNFQITCCEGCVHSCPTRVHVSDVVSSRKHFQVTRINESCHTYEWVMSHMWMSPVTHVNESCQTCEWVMSHMWMSHGTHVNEACHTCEWALSHMWMSPVTHVNESCHTCEWVMSHMWMSQVTHANESCHSCECVMLLHRCCARPTCQQLPYHIMPKLHIDYVYDGVATISRLL